MKLPSTVFVGNWPPPDLTSVHWAQAGVAIAAVALIVAIITLTRVNRQIAIANETLTQAKAELKLAQDSNELLTQDLGFSRTQAAFVARRAKLALGHDRHRVGRRIGSVDTGEPETQIPVSLWIFNDGDMTARDCTIFLWLPWPEWKVPGWDGVLNPEKPFATQGLKVIANVKVDDRRYWHVSADVPFPTYPSVERLALTFQAVLPLPYEGDLLWRIGYDDGMQPPINEPQGRLRFQTIRKSP